MSDVKFTVDAGLRDRFNCPVSVIVDGPGCAAVQYDETILPCQTRPLADGRTEISFILDRLNAGQSRDFSAAEADPNTLCPMQIQDDGQRAVTVLCNEQVVSAYHYADPESARPYWFPVLDPYGNRLTRGFPMIEVPGERRDHKHHRSMYVAYGDVNGTDNWSEQPGHGTQTHEGWNALVAGHVYALLDHNVCWRSPEGAPQLNERRIWKVYNLPASGRMWDLEINFTGAEGVGAVTFGDTKEGGLLSLRVTTSMDAPKGRIENSLGGINEGETWGKQAAWCDYSGPVNGNWVGITAFEHPTSFRYPTYWHVRNYGLMTANPFGLSYFTEGDPYGQRDGTHVLAAGDSLTFRYRVYVHPGDAQAGQVRTKYQDYANPPVVKLG